MTHPPETMRAIRQDAKGQPLYLADIPVPEPGRGEVLIKVAASPINPSDLMMLEGEYGTTFAYPMTPGLEGAGEVVKAGPGLMPAFLRGRRVACAGGRQGLWAEYAVLPATQCLPMPQDIPMAAGAMAMVNPLTAYAFGRILRRKRQRAVVSTAAAGQLGAMIRKTCKGLGVKVINVVRSEAQRAALEAEGAIALDMTAEGFQDALAATCKRLRCSFALDAVAGHMTFQLIEAMPPRSEVMVYGALSLQACRAHPGTLIFKESRVTSFWLTRWLARKSLPEMMWITRQVMTGLQGGFATSEIARQVPLEETASAPAAYMEDMSAGKWLITPNGPV